MFRVLALIAPSKILEVAAKNPGKTVGYVLYKEGKAVKPISAPGEAVLPEANPYTGGDQKSKP